MPQIKEGKISNKRGMRIINKLFNNYYVLLSLFLVNDEITKYFAFELDGFKFSIEKININNMKQKKKEKKEKKEEKEKNLIDGINEMESESDEENIIEKNKESNDEDNNELNEELIKMIENEEVGTISNKNIFTKQETEFMDKFIYLKNIQNQAGEKINLKNWDDILKIGNKSNPKKNLINL